MNGAKIYVGNLSWGTNDETLRNVFSQYGNVLDSIVMRDRETGRSRGFGFVTYATQEEASGAIATANGVDIDGRQIKVNLANARGSAGGTAAGHAPGMYAPQPFGYGGFPQAGGFPPGAQSAPYGAGFGAFQPPQPQGSAGGFVGGFPNQGPGGYGAPANQFQGQGGYPGGY
ncbi:unnamed protein product [Rhizoctonia solani]|uniref:RRM domain-containing protein n=1 Tax=Rhizoctonia solani TaxID=456999 RepID=A0A8H3GI07_9AGAM|nr:unnamed protein product [Rhizoctonia solani]